MKKHEEKIFLRFEIFIIHIDICIHNTIEGNTNIAIHKKRLIVDHIRQARRDFTCLVRYSY